MLVAPAFARDQPDLDIPLTRVHLQPRSPALAGYSKAQGRTYSLTVGMVASLLSLTGLIMSTMCYTNKIIPASQGDLARPERIELPFQV
jgi:hypothetical protein